MRWIVCLVTLSACGSVQPCGDSTNGLCFINRGSADKASTAQVLAVTQDVLNAHGVDIDFDVFFEHNSYSVEYVDVVGDNPRTYGRTYVGFILVKNRDEWLESQTLSHELLHAVSIDYVGDSFEDNKTHQVPLLFKLYCARKYGRTCDYTETIEGQIQVELDLLRYK